MRPFGIISWAFLLFSLFFSVKHLGMLLWKVRFCIDFALANITTSHKALMIHIISLQYSEELAGSQTKSSATGSCHVV